MSTNQPTPAQIKRWRGYLANEQAEAAAYRDLARRRSGEEQEILLTLADAEHRHADYWIEKLGVHAENPPKPDIKTRLLGFLARRFGSVFTLALMQSAEARSPYDNDADASRQISADERIHAEVIRGLASRGRENMSGNFRAAVFGINDGLVSNLALVMGVMATGVSAQIVLITGISGLLSGALSMAAGEYISVRSQTELLDASLPDPKAREALHSLDVESNELELVYRARGMSEEEAQAKATRVFNKITQQKRIGDNVLGSTEAQSAGSARSAAAFSFFAFAIGAFLPIIPYVFGMSGLAGAVVSLILVGISLMATGATTGLLSGKPPGIRAIRQLSIGYGAALVTYVLGLLFGLIL
ncbi:membrane protein [Corynebacterium suranareeae]|uniref:Membrane protein n=1 Tax=Corynebacterium suranareeae TaxID=2506452 RepID=A0A160PRA9_9CORY|nr:VIT1/CCC1 transporter family protein [Corynebacterium suranareeae]BAU96609.1 membrane protein [Corynebacterium suranareeae]